MWPGSDSRSEFVAVMQASKPRYGNNLRIHRRTLCRCASGRRILAQAEMCPVIMVIANVLRHEPLQVASVDNNNMIEQLSAAATYPSLCNAVLPWATNRCSYRADA